MLNLYWIRQNWVTSQKKVWHNSCMIFGWSCNPLTGEETDGLLCVFLNVKYFLCRALAFYSQGCLYYLYMPAPQIIRLVIVKQWTLDPVKKHNCFNYFKAPHICVHLPSFKYVSDMADIFHRLLNRKSSLDHLDSPLWVAGLLLKHCRGQRVSFRIDKSLREWWWLSFLSLR